MPLDPAPVPGPSPQIRGATYRFTLLTSRLVRMEYSAAGVFVDEPSQLALHRDLDVPEHRVERTPEGLEILTEHLHIRYDEERFSPSGLTVTLRGRAQDAHVTTWRHGIRASGNLGGTVRTLDNVDGRTDLGDGLMSTNGFTVVDDSVSLLLTEDGWVHPRPEAAQDDLYFFGYGRDYSGALRDFFRLSGPTPLLPRYALGNWWSRYHAYADTEYLALMDAFVQGGIPFSVAVLDMDWHLVDIDPRHGSGWTGYTWNRELFAAPEQFLAELHRRNLRVTLNVHPADGVRPHEEAYEAVARDLGIDPTQELTIGFEISSRTFVESYLTRLHHPHEDIGVDFWWLDWQSGSHSRMPGLDPLWLLNHVHFHDSGRDGRRPLTFSRYAGLGSHRYPIGFSGDTVVSWDSLRFQPELTATAANVGYFWWSHDIGGHFRGTQDPELTARWFQLGAFSPINRLHSTNSVFSSKEPWRFGPEYASVMTEALRMRHRLLPYLYTLNWQAHAEGVPPVRPLYHEHPHHTDAYDLKQEYLLGPALLVAPVTEPREPVTGLARADAWLPPGAWYDLGTARRYEAGRSGRRLTLYRSLAQIPVLARAGSIVPLSGDVMADAEQNPHHLVLRLHAGADGKFTLLEDDGGADVRATERHETPMRWTWRATSACLRIDPPRGREVLTQRTIDLEIAGIVGAEVTITADGERRTIGGECMEVTSRTLRVDLGQVRLAQGVTIELTSLSHARVPPGTEIFDLLAGGTMPLEMKEQAWRLVSDLDGTALAAALHAMDLPGHLYGASLELLSAADAG